MEHLNKMESDMSGMYASLCFEPQEAIVKVQNRINVPSLEPSI